MIIQNGEPIVHNLGTGRLRIDKPMPPLKNTLPAGKTTAALASAISVPAAPTRPLSRLEKLRLESKTRAKPASTNH